MRRHKGGVVVPVPQQSLNAAHHADHVVVLRRRRWNIAESVVDERRFPAGGERIVRIEGAIRKPSRKCDRIGVVGRRGLDLSRRAGRIDVVLEVAAVEIGGGMAVRIEGETGIDAEPALVGLIVAVQGQVLLAVDIPA